MAPQAYRLSTRHSRGNGQEQRQGIVAFYAQSKRERYEEVDKDNGVLVQFLSMLEIFQILLGI